MHYACIHFFQEACQKVSQSIWLGQEVFISTGPYSTNHTNAAPHKQTKRISANTGLKRLLHTASWAWIHRTCWQLWVLRYFWVMHKVKQNQTKNQKTSRTQIDSGISLHLYSCWCSIKTSAKCSKCKWKYLTILSNEFRIRKKMYSAKVCISTCLLQRPLTLILKINSTEKYSWREDSRFKIFICHMQL